jgi:hypothetical protein
MNLAAALARDDKTLANWELKRGEDQGASAIENIF